jgi:hypothetical protein
VISGVSVAMHSRVFENDLTKRGIALEVAVGGGNLIEREDPIDDSMYDATREQWHHLRREGARHGDLFLERPRAEHRPADR